MANDPKYNVRVTFINGNGITLDCKGCGQIWLEPNHDYFFENSPIKFINYLAQLRRVGITYKITEDKRGCYQTFDMSRYESGNPRNIISKLRGTRVSKEEPTVEEPVEEEITETTEETTVEEPATKGAPEVPEVVETPEVESADSDTGEEEVTEEVQEETSEPEVTEETTNEEVEEEPVDVDSLNKKDLIEYAHSLGLTEISDIYTKKEIKEAIAKLQEGN